MKRAERRPSAGVMFAALLAVTLNLMQPLVHAVLMRDGGPGVLWSAWCKAAAADPDRPGRVDRETSVPPIAGGQHECCLGLACAPAQVAPSDAFVLLSPIRGAALALLPVEQRPSAAIRDGPPQPRGPPSSPTT